jgi:hypothetical protein
MTTEFIQADVFACQMCKKKDLTIKDLTERKTEFGERLFICSECNAEMDHQAAMIDKDEADINSTDAQIGAEYQEKGL